MAASSRLNLGDEHGDMPIAAFSDHGVDILDAAIFNVIDAQRVGLRAIEADLNGEQWQRIWRLWTKYWAMGLSRIYEGVKASHVWLTPADTS